MIGILSFATVMLGGYSREASRPRFVDRISAYDNVFVPSERQPYLMAGVNPKDIPKVPAPPKPTGAASLIRQKCSGCHTLDRVKLYPLDNWEVVVWQMMAYGVKLTPHEEKEIVTHLKSGEPY